MSSPMSRLRELREVLIPPPDPIGTGSSDLWHRLEGRVGLILPGDYKEFVSTYGYGAIGGEVFLLNPFIDKHPGYNFERELARQREVEALFAREGWTVTMFDEQSSYLGEQPMPRGLIPWGGDQDGRGALWETTDPDPELWTIYIFDGHGAVRFPESLTTFILKSLRGRSAPMFSRGWRPPVSYVTWPLRND